MKAACIVSTAILVLAFVPAHAEPLTGGCGTMQALAQEHANDMARRYSADHAGFKGRAARWRPRGKRGDGSCRRGRR